MADHSDIFDHFLDMPDSLLGPYRSVDTENMPSKLQPLARVIPMTLARGVVPIAQQLQNGSTTAGEGNAHAQVPADITRV